MCCRSQIYRTFILRLWLGLLLLLFVVLPTKARSDAHHPNLLILHSYHQGLEWTDAITEGILSVFQGKSSYPDIHIEYLDTKRHQSDAYLEQLIELFHRKGMDGANDMIIASDNFALTFLQKYGKTLYPGTPIVFCGVNNYRPDMIEGMDWITGVEEHVDHQATLNLMLSIHPETQKILVVCDSSRTGREIKEDFERKAQPFISRVRFEYVQDFRLDELPGMIAAQKPGCLIYMNVLNIDRDNRFVSYREGLDLITRSSKVPVYSSWDVYLGKGIVGGMITSGFDQGSTAALMARQILNGRHPSAVPMVKHSPTRLMFDHAMLRQFDISTTRLPPGAILINKPPGFWKKEFRLILPLIAGLVLMSLIFFWNAGKQARRERQLEQTNRELDQGVAEKTRALKEVNDQLRTVLNTMPSPIFFKDKKGVYQGCNTAFAELVFGLSTQEVVGASFEDMKGIVPDDLLDLYLSKDLELIDKPGVQIYEAQVPCAHGIRRDFLFNRAPIINDKGDVAGIVGVMIDITRQKADAREREALIEKLRQANEKLEQLSITDALTGLSNRGHINRRIDEEIRKAERYKTTFSLIMIDLDHFKAINDTFGHQVGDLVLQSVARILGESIRDIDLAGRFGGEEFMVLLPNTDRKGALLIAERIRHSVAALVFEANLTRITISGGVAEYQGEGATDLFKNVDDLLYKAKAGGRNRIIDTP